LEFQTVSLVAAFRFFRVSIQWIWILVELRFDRVSGKMFLSAEKAKGKTKKVTTSRMKTDRRQLDRLVDPESKSVKPSTLRHKAKALWCQ
jgi:hypothetical protein